MVVELGQMNVGIEMRDILILEEKTSQNPLRSENVPLLALRER